MSQPPLPSGALTMFTHPTSPWKHHIGVDFGTAYSSVSIAFKKSEERINHQDLRYASLSNESTDTCIATKCAYDFSSIPPKFFAGDDAVSDLLLNKTIDSGDVFTWLKAALCDTTEPHILGARAESVNKPLERLRNKSGAHKYYTAENIVIDFAEFLSLRISREIDHKGLGIEGPYPVQVVLGHPSTWSVVEMGRLRELFTRGFLRTGWFAQKHQENLLEISLCHESIGALAANMLSRDTTLKTFQTDEPILFLDCGGATVQALIATVLSTNQMKQVVPGDCFYAGGVFVNECFRDRFTKILLRFHRRLRLSPQALVEQAMASFERKKRSFTGEANSDVTIECRSMEKLQSNASAAAGYTCNEGRVRIDRREMIRIFEPSLAKVKELVLRQLHECEEAGFPLPKICMLSGCYAMSEHLINTLRGEFPKLGFIQGLSKMQTVVSDGILLAGKDSRLIRDPMLTISYGFKYDEIYMPGFHPDSLLDEYNSRSHTKKLPRGFMGLVSDNDDPSTLVLKDLFEIGPRRGTVVVDGSKWVVPSRRDLYCLYGSQELYCEEVLYMSHKTHAGGSSIGDPKNEIYPVATLKIRIPSPSTTDGAPLNPYNFELLTAPQKPRKRARRGGTDALAGFRVYFFLVICYRGGSLEYQYMVPKGGKFPSGEFEDLSDVEVIDKYQDWAFVSDNKEFSIANAIPFPDNM